MKKRLRKPEFSRRIVRLGGSAHHGRSFFRNSPCPSRILCGILVSLNCPEDSNHEKKQNGSSVCARGARAERGRLRTASFRTRGRLRDPADRSQRLRGHRVSARRVVAGEKGRVQRGFSPRHAGRPSLFARRGAADRGRRSDARNRHDGLALSGLRRHRRRHRGALLRG